MVPVGCADDVGERCAAGRRVAVLHQRGDGRLGGERRDGRAGEVEIGEPDDLALAHGNAAEDLGDVFAEADLHDQLLGVAELAHLGQPVGIMHQLAHGEDVGGEPREAVGGALLLLQQSGRNAPAVRHLGLHQRGRLGQQLLQAVGGGTPERNGVELFGRDGLNGGAGGHELSPLIVHCAIALSLPRNRAKATPDYESQGQAGSGLVQPMVRRIRLYGIGWRGR